MTGGSFDHEYLYWVGCAGSFDDKNKKVTQATATLMKRAGIDFAILEDRKFKTGPLGTIPPMGPRPDHITDERYDPKAIDLPGLQLLGERQLKFLRDWTQDWKGAEIKCVLSQTAFCGAVHIWPE